MRLFRSRPYGRETESETQRAMIEFEVSGRYALFTDPLTRVGGEKSTYHFPTYEAIKGVVSSVYWRPTFIWVVDRIRILNRVTTEAKSAKPLNYVGGGNSLAIYTYLKDVRYQIQAHFEWNLHREDLRSDRIDGKHQDIAKRSVVRGGRRDVYLGTRECQAYVTPCRFGEDCGYYDDVEELPYGLMFHGFDYPSETGGDAIYARFYHPIVRRGVIEFPRPDDGSLIRRKLRPATPQDPEVLTPLEDVYNELG